MVTQRDDLWSAGKVVVGSDLVKNVYKSLHYDRVLASVKANVRRKFECTSNFSSTALHRKSMLMEMRMPTVLALRRTQLLMARRLSR